MTAHWSGPVIISQIQIQSARVSYLTQLSNQSHQPGGGATLKQGASDKKPDVVMYRYFTGRYLQNEGRVMFSFRLQRCKRRNGGPLQVYCKFRTFLHWIHFQTLMFHSLFMQSVELTDSQTQKTAR